MSLHFTVYPISAMTKDFVSYILTSDVASRESRTSCAVVVLTKEEGIFREFRDPMIFQSDTSLISTFYHSPKVLIQCPSL